jgi:predicted Zn-dependent protease
MPSHLKAVLAIGCAAAAVVSCAINQQQEVELGAQTAAEIDTTLPLIRDPAINAYINGLGKSARPGDRHPQPHLALRRGGQ